MTAIQAEFIGYRTYEKKPYVRLIFEIPVEKETEVRAVLGNTPLPGTSVWVGIARLKQLDIIEDVLLGDGEVNNKMLAG